MKDFKLLKKIINDNQKFILTTHVNPDADAIGSEVALYLVLKELKKETKIINHSATPNNLLFLDYDKVIEKFEIEKHIKFFNDADVLIGLDFNRSDRMVSMEETFLNSNAIKIYIDHHQDPEKFVDIEYSDSAYSATGAILYDFINDTQIVDFNLKIAEALYAAIMTDTGSFRFERTTPNVHRIAAALLEIGVQPHIVQDKIYDQNKFSKVRLIGKALDSMQLYGKKKEVSYMLLNQDTFDETGAVESDTDGLVNFCLTVENVKIGLLFIELKNGFKVSFRSKGEIPVNKLAAEFGGGGHRNAAGARFFNEKLEDYLPKILEKATQYINEN